MSYYKNLRDQGGNGTNGPSSSAPLTRSPALSSLHPVLADPSPGASTDNRVSSGNSLPSSAVLSVVPRFC
ncbi:uncharacterized protein DS421_19g652650 [Arachis hypogaea]|uniref:Uncharacterized protein n=1 Tax=Arachis hypogaea TaxID=3818 RepID=A0A6B9V9R1_ARAHY|nr:uncharacterized protein DS421_19g652650 [Arachis hypogaea]